MCITTFDYTFPPSQKMQMFLKALILRWCTINIVTQLNLNLADILKNSIVHCTYIMENTYAL